MREYATDVKFHHVHIPLFLGKINQVADKAIEKVQTYVKNVFEESMMHYHKDNQYADNKKSQRYARLITDHNIFETNESIKLIKYFQEDLQSLTKTLPTSNSRISHWLNQYYQ
jgi:hypothetical protein